MKLLFQIIQSENFHKQWLLEDEDGDEFVVRKWRYETSSILLSSLVIKYKVQNNHFEICDSSWKKS